jgi:hypothetical protein
MRIGVSTSAAKGLLGGTFHGKIAGEKKYAWDY